MNQWNLGGAEVDSPPAPINAKMEAGSNASRQEKRVSKSLSKAVSLHLEGKLDDAMRELHRTIEAGERHPALYSALGHVQYEVKNYAEAVNSYAQLLDLEPAHRTGHFNLAVSLGKLARWAEAATSFEKALEIDPRRTEAYLGLGTCLVHLKRPEEALDAFNCFVFKYPDHEEALFGKAVALQQAGRLDEATEFYQKVLLKNPKSEEALSNLTSVCLEKKDFAQARKYAEALLELNPESQAAMEAVATVGLCQRRFADGGDALQIAGGYSRPTNYENWFNLGVAYQRLGNYQNAAAAYHKAAEIKPGSAQVHLNLGVSYQEVGDLSAARAAYEHALMVEPEMATALWNLALILEQLGERNEAEKLYARTAGKEPGVGGCVLPAGISAPAARRFSRQRGSLRAVPGTPSGVAGSAVERGDCLLARGRSPVRATGIRKSTVAQARICRRRTRAGCSHAGTGRFRAGVRSASAPDRVGRPQPRTLLQRRPDLPEARADGGCRGVLSRGVEGESQSGRSPAQPGPRTDGYGSGRRGSVLLAQGGGSEA